MVRSGPSRPSAHAGSADRQSRLGSAEDGLMSEPAAIHGRDRSFEALLPRCSFPPAGTEVTCGVSGGPDSMALLALATAAGLVVTAVHVDHCLRPGSAGEADVV